MLGKLEKTEIEVAELHDIYERGLYNGIRGYYQHLENLSEENTEYFLDGFKDYVDYMMDDNNEHRTLLTREVSSFMLAVYDKFIARIVSIDWTFRGFYIFDEDIPLFKKWLEICEYFLSKVLLEDLNLQMEHVRQTIEFFEERKQ